MKAVKFIGLGLLVSFLIVALALTLFLKNFDPNKYKRQILDQAREVLQRDVDFDRIDLEVSFKEGVRLRLSDVRIAEDPAFGTEDLLRVGRLRAGLDLGALLLKRQIVVPSLSVEEMRLRVIRDKEGRLNLMALVPASPEGGDSSSPAAGVPVSKALAAPMLFVREVDLSGEVAYRDNTFEAPIALTVSRIAASAKNVSLTNPFVVTAQAALFADAPNVSVEAKLQLDLDAAGILFTEARARLGLGKISQKDLRESIPMLSVMPAWSILNGQIDAEAARIKIGGGALVALEATAKLTQGELAFKDIPLSLGAIKAQLQATATQVDIQEFSAELGGGRITGSGSLKDYLSSPSYAGTVTMSGVRAQEFFDQSAWPAKGEGVLNGTVRIQGRGFDPQDALRQLGGEGRLDVSEAKVKDFNALAFILGKITVLPDVVGRVEASLPERFKQKLTQVDTPLTSLRSGLVITNGALRLDPIVVAADEFSFEAKGSVGFDSSLDISGSFSIPPDLSASMIAGVPELKYLMDLRNRISLPVSAKGRAGAVSVSVDAGDLAKRVLVSEGVNQLQKVLGIDKAASAAPEGEAATQGSAPPEKQAIAQVLGALLGGASDQTASAATPAS